MRSLIVCFLNLKLFKTVLSIFLIICWVIVIKNSFSACSHLVANLEETDHYFKLFAKQMLIFMQLGFNRVTDKQFCSILVYYETRKSIYSHRGMVWFKSWLKGELNKRSLIKSGGQWFVLLNQGMKGDWGSSIAFVAFTALWL